MTLKLRQAQLSDRDRIVFFHRALYLEHRGEIMPPELGPLYAYRGFEEVLRDDVDAMLRNPATHLLVAEDEGGEPLGYVSGYIANDPRRLLSRKGVMGDWYVVPGSRGRGVGRRLFEALLGIFREAGCSQVETSTWPFNTATRRVMEELGFREIQITYRAPIDAFDGD
ncbi:MAG TPA: GNAT family N-acetyltransferase [Polyangiaceae bacterium LLY-WYZ-15_(1-7)]|nr:GNAT family N-acetyltransferase [Polyangiaceae bacterium LLY-WYZ-15_(1-7)]HJL09767.1 GNAT family N-acetyltransferase [Polyangiaceae bacterium LLY-WYZ-15_(1-7)]HJL21528.1 GNAT family N-acetyltransferase [Polyangiaceae bacterium LLY-WYZ-15_(1-7)]HJL33114.1 GNAT family N-acetyltransferase [Polyangiaceae bacterium LLY-WYZ-15_(1-7)]HJL34931.1 GNAT family N-acetyltransferase [Polyangiaceae bacterium LLY-WYZ-15_(1-7)]